MKQTQSYIVCATPRSGSTLLCDLLTDTGMAGVPNSFFRRESFAEWAEYFGVSVVAWDDEHVFDHAYLAAAIREGIGETQMFGMRLMWESLGDLSKRLDTFYPRLASDHARFQAAFGPPVYLHLSRQDKVAQAVSHLKAEQSGLWHVAADGSERERLKVGHAPAYDAEDLAELVAEAEQHDAAWVDWFAREGIAPVSITYEGLSSDPQATLARVLSALGLDPTIAEKAQPRTARLADRESREWAARFRTE
ncbi:MAG: Stf0 family sulfotransferase [Pseudomonadota bacterium]